MNVSGVVLFPNRDDIAFIQRKALDHTLKSGPLYGAEGYLPPPPPHGSLCSDISIQASCCKVESQAEQSGSPWSP